MKITQDITKLIGNTPLFELQRLFGDTGVRVLAKLEMFNIMSVKDRAVLSMVTAAIDEGKIREGTEVVEASSGNTAIALALLASRFGFTVRAYMSESTGVERRQILCAYGAKVILTPAAEHTRGARDRAIKYCQENPEKSFFLNQHGNPNNARSHITMTGPELWEATSGELDVMLIGLGTGGTFEGLSTYLKAKKPSIRIVGFEPETSPVYAGGNQGEHHLIGIGPGFITENFKRAAGNIDEILHIQDDAAYSMVRRIAREEGILVGPTSGAAAVAAEQLIKRDDLRGKTVGLIFYDTGERYLNVNGLFPSDNIEFVN